MPLMKSLIVLFLMAFGFRGVPSTGAVSFRVHLAANKYITAPQSGRLFVLMNGKTDQLPLYWPDTSNPQPAFALDVKDFKPGTSVMVGENACYWMHRLRDLNGTYSVSALLDVDTRLCSILAPGNLISDKSIIEIKKGEDRVYDLTIDFPIQPFPFEETSVIREEKIESKLLSDFLGRPTDVTAAVILPESYVDNLDRRYPVVYVFPGWGGNRFHMVQGDFQQKRYGMSSEWGKEKIFVFMDQECRYGYHVFANSENNGPWADAFVREFIPAIERKYRISGQPPQRYLSGQSSGGWAAAWLQVQYPDLFRGAWIASPDPLDFSHFENWGNIYDPTANLYFDENGRLRDHMRKGENPIISNADYVKMETVYGEGYQINSYESVFGKKGPNGKPEKIFDRASGRVNPEVAEHWKFYDIRRILANGSPSFLKKISGKLHIFVSNDDDYYLNLAVRGLKEETDRLGLDIEFVFFDGLGHNVWNDDFRKRIHQAIDLNSETASRSGE